MRRTRPGTTRLTSSGTGFALGAPLLGAVGVVTGYRELIVLAGAGLTAVIAAVLSPRARTAADLRRTVARRLVPAGGRVRCLLEVRAVAAMAATRVVDALDGVEVPIAVPGLAAGGVARWRYEVPVHRRGVHRLGPLVEERDDALELARRSIRHDGDEQVVWVHPVVHELGPVRSPGNGWRERRATGGRGDDPLAEFRSLRAYVPGDDTRLVHWTTSARLGRLVVREVTERTGIDRMVVLDTAAGLLSAGAFEAAVEIAASVAVQGLRAGLAVVVRTTDARAMGPARPVAGRDEVLRLLATVGRTAPPATLPAPAVLSTLAADDTILVTGAVPSAVLAQLLATGQRRRTLSVVRVSDHPASLPRLPVPTDDVRSAPELVHRWRARA